MLPLKKKLDLRASPPMAGEPEGEGLQLTLLANPNASPTAFQAKVLFGLKDHHTGIQINTEIPLHKFKQDLDEYLKTN